VGKYSVLMSLYIKEKPEYLKLAVESMIRQTIIPDEIVIVKDGPLTTELEEVLQEYMDKYPELFNIVAIENNIGLGLALNLGLKNCKNELVARMDTDDIAMPERCEKQLQAFEKDTELSILGGNISEFIDCEKNIVSRRIVPTDYTEIGRYLKKRCPLNHMTVMFKKSEVLKAGNYCEWFWNEDYYLWIRMFEAGCKFGNLPEVLVNVRVGKDMYKRRGGLEYFKSEAALQKYMLEKKIIGFRTFTYNVAIRFVLQVIMTDTMRGFVFKKLARK
jgi:glycosyltransferase involved in cell wall biosynthesis